MPTDTKKKSGRPYLGNKRIHIALEPDLYEMVQRRADAETRLFSNMINVILRESFEGKAGSPSASA